MNAGSPGPLVHDVDDAALDAAVDRWRDQGFAVLRGVGRPDTIARLRDRFDDLITGRMPDPGLFFQPDAASGRYDDVVSEDGWRGPDVAYRKVERLDLDPLFWAWATNPVFERLVQRVHPRGARLYRATVFQKVARRGSETPWHQDGGRLWGLSRDPELQVWTALDAAGPDSGALEGVPGSHHWGLATDRGGLVPAAHVATSGADRLATRIDAAPGDVVLLHNLAWHRTGANTSDAPRRAFTLSLLDADVRCARTRRAPRVFRSVFPALG